MTTEEIVESIRENYPDCLLADGLDGALIGWAYTPGRGYYAVYDAERCIEILALQGRTYAEAAEYFEFNTEGASVGDGTPVFLHDMRNE
jgi:hypothetical protein